MSAKTKYREESEFEAVSELLNNSSDDELDPRWKDRAQGMHKLADHYEDISDEEIAEVYNELKAEETTVPTQIVAEEAAFKYSTEDIELEEAIKLSKEQYS